MGPDPPWYGRARRRSDREEERKDAVPKPAILRKNGTAPYDYLVVGAGFAGSVLAERLAAAGKRVFLCDRRPHIAGNAFDVRNEAGISNP